MLQETPLPAIDWPEPECFDLVHFAMHPGQGKFRKELIDQLLTHCSQNLPKEMIPREIILVDTLARNADGDVDSSAVLAARSASRLP